MKTTKKLNNNEFIARAKLIHGDKYDYSLTFYNGALSKVKLICPVHGEFEQRASDHLYGKKCWKCAHKEKSDKQYLTNDDFINKAKLIHGDKYNYSLVIYDNNTSKVSIICSKHGLFQQKPVHHLRGQGCPICRESKGEKAIRRYLIENNIEFIHQHKFNECRNIKILSFDFYLPDLNLIIEYQGRQHFKIIDKWGGEEKLEKQLINDKIKRNYCLENKINFIAINYNENIFDKLKQNLKYYP